MGIAGEDAFWLHDFDIFMTNWSQQGYSTIPNRRKFSFSKTWTFFLTNLLRTVSAVEDFVSKISLPSNACISAETTSSFTKLFGTSDGVIKET